MRGLVASILVCAFGLSVGGCLADPMTLDIGFPNEESFLYSSTARIRLYNVGSDDGNLCPQLIAYNVDGLGTVDEPAYDSGTIDICDLRDGGYTFDDIGAAERAVVVVIEDANNHVLMFGCTTATTAVDAAAIEITLQRTPDYPDFVESLPELSCTSMDEKCTRGC